MTTFRPKTTLADTLSRHKLRKHSVVMLHELFFLKYKIGGTDSQMAHTRV